MNENIRVERANLIREIDSLSQRVRDSLRRTEQFLSSDYMLEYYRLLSSKAVFLWPDAHDLKMLQLETGLYIGGRYVSDAKTPQALRWLENSLQRCKETIQRLSPDLYLASPSLHPAVAEASLNLFRDGHYPQAIFEAFKTVEEQVKQKSGESRLFGYKLMSTVFNKNKPRLKVVPSVPDTWEEEQDGFMHLFIGAMMAIKNPKSHHNIEQSDSGRTLQYLHFASLLLSIVGSAEVVGE